LYEKVKEVHKTKGGAPAGTTLLTDVWGGLTGNGYSGNGGISFTIHDEVETAQAVTEQMPTGSWYTTPPKWCAQCDENGDPTGEQVADFFKCYGGNSQCERRCVCKDSREAGLTKCEACNDDFCVVHKGRRPLVTGVVLPHGCAGHACEDAWFAPYADFPKLAPNAPKRPARTATRKKAKTAVADSDAEQPELAAQSSDDEQFV
jgi:hypothetical protein